MDDGWHHGETVPLTLTFRAMRRGGASYNCGSRRQLGYGLPRHPFVVAAGAAANSIASACPAKPPSHQEQRKASAKALQYKRKACPGRTLRSKILIEAPGRGAESQPERGACPWRSEVPSQRLGILRSAPFAVLAFPERRCVALCAARLRGTKRSSRRALRCRRMAPRSHSVSPR